MVNLKDNIRYQNVLSKKYYVDVKEVESCMKSFCDELKDRNIKIKGPMFYALYGYSEEGPVDIEIFAPTFSSKQQPRDLNFHSYYSVEHMASARVMGNLDENEMPTLRTLLMTINSFQAKVISPIYFVIDNIMGEPYITIKVAYSKDTELNG